MTVNFYSAPSQNAKVLEIAHGGIEYDCKDTDELKCIHYYYSDLCYMIFSNLLAINKQHIYYSSLSNDIQFHKFVNYR